MICVAHRLEACEDEGPPEEGTLFSLGCGLGLQAVSMETAAAQSFGIAPMCVWRKYLYLFAVGLSGFNGPLQPVLLIQ